MRQILPYLLMLFLLLISCNSGNEHGSSGSQKGQEGKKIDRATPVETVQLKRGKIGSYLLLSTTITTEQDVEVFSQANGFVKSFKKEEGDLVKKNEVLIELDAREVQIRYQKSKINYEEKKKEYERLSNAKNKDLLSKDEVERIQYSYLTAQQDFKQAELDLDYASIESPISGVVTERKIQIGKRINVGTSVYKIMNFNERIAVLQVPEREVGNIATGQKVLIFSESLRNEDGDQIEFQGKVKRVSPIVDPTSGTFKVTISLSNNSALKPGMFVNARIETDLKENSLLIPKSTVIYENEKKYVFVVKDSIASKIDIIPGYENSYEVESLNDKISSGDHVVLLGKQGLKDGSKVKVVNQSKKDKQLSKKE
jgi:membrane fusion protein, multidrug efflux system